MEICNCDIVSGVHSRSHWDCCYLFLSVVSVLHKPMCFMWFYDTVLKGYRSVATLTSNDSIQLLKLQS